MTSGRSRFDFAFIPAAPFSETIEFVQLGERLGYRCAWLPDQTFHRDPGVMLGLCAQATSEIGLGLGITSPFTRLPVQIARMAAVLDEVSGCRFRLGLGTANASSVLAPLGIRLERAVGRLRDATVIIRGLLTGETVDFEGPDDLVRGVRLDFDPPRADLPIYLGTRGPKTLALAGELADGVLAESLFNAGGMPYVMDRLAAGAQRSGRSPDEVDVVSWQLVQVVDEPEAAIAAMKPWVAYSITVGPPEAMRRIGMEEEVIAAVTEAMSEGDKERAARLVTDDAVRCLMIIGNPAEVRKQLEDLFAAGASSVCLLLMGSMEQMHSTLRRFAQDVLPAFSER